MAVAVFFLICTDKHISIAYLSHGGVAGSDERWSTLVQCSQPTDLTSSTLTLSDVYKRPPCFLPWECNPVLAAPDSNFEQLNTILNNI